MSCDSPRSLADKVQFDIRFYFCRRGCENMHAMTKDTFEVCVDGEGHEFVRQARGELNKNHNETDRVGYTGFMPAHAGSELCPVAAFKNYVSHLNPMCDSLWQRPLDSVASTRVVWYYNRPIGVNTLATFMRRLSEKCSLSKTYRNHSVRVTGVTLLRQLRFGQKQVMSVSGHKSVSSMVVYERVSDEDKMLMGRSLTALFDGLPPPIQQHSRFFSSHFLQPWPRPVQLRQHLWQAAQQSLTLQMWSNVHVRSASPCSEGLCIPCPCFSSRCGRFQFQSIAQRSWSWSRVQYVGDTEARPVIPQLRHQKYEHQCYDKKINSHTTPEFLPVIVLETVIFHVFPLVASCICQNCTWFDGF